MLADGATAPHPGSTKRALYGPEVIVYDRAESGAITGYIEQSVAAAREAWAWLPATVEVSA